MRVFFIEHLALVVALAAAVPDLEKPLLRIRFCERTRARVHLLGAAKQRARSVATAVVIPQRPVVLAVARRPRCTDANVLRRAMQTELHSDGIRTCEVRVIWVDEEPRRLGPGACLAHDRRWRGEGDVATTVRGADLSTSGKRGGKGARTFGCRTHVAARSTR